jgi:hypothetical protein
MARFNLRRWPVLLVFLAIWSTAATARSVLAASARLRTAKPFTVAALPLEVRQVLDRAPRAAR